MINYIEIKMPALSPTMTKGKLVEWKKKVGDKIKAGDVLFEIETDKAVMEYESVEEGFLAAILVPGDTSDVDVGKLVCVLASKKEEVDVVTDQFKNYKENSAAGLSPAPEKQEEEVKKQDEFKPYPVDGQFSDHDSRIKASPIAKRLASENGIKLDSISSGSGPMGRIIKNDILKAVQNKPSSETKNNISFENQKQNLAPEKIPVSIMRKVIAERLLESKITIPHFYLTVDLIMDNLIELRAKINSGFEALKQNSKITINDLFIKIVAKALETHPEINVSWGGDHILQYKTIDISVAVSIEGGLITPIVFGADKLSLSQISSVSKGLIEKAKGGKLKPSEFQGGSITISNMGMMGVDEFAAIINPPQSSILAIGGLKKQPVVINDQILIKQITKITLSCDHRAVDGALAAVFLNKIKFFAENPEMLFS